MHITGNYGNYESLRTIYELVNVQNAVSQAVTEQNYGFTDFTEKKTNLYIYTYIYICVFFVIP